MTDIPKKKGTNFPMLVNMGSDNHKPIIPHPKEPSVLDEILAEAKATTKSDNPLVHICWLIQGLPLGNYSLEQTQRYVVSNILNGFISKQEVEEAIPFKYDPVTSQGTLASDYRNQGYNQAIDEIRKRLGIG